MARSIFKILKNNSKIQSEFRRSVHEFLVQGGYSDSEVDQFICENYLLSVPELTNKWNIAHPKKEKKKKEITFYGQVSVLSNKILHLFGVNSSEFEELLLSEDDTNPKAQEIIGFIKAFGVSQTPLEERFSFTLADYISDYEPVQDYELSECLKEIQLLRIMDKDNLATIFSKVDKDKLAYVMQMMKADLVLYDAVEYEQISKQTKEVIKKADGSTSMRKVYNPVINDLKVALLLLFNNMKQKDLRVVKQQIDKDNQSGVLAMSPADSFIDANVNKPKEGVKFQSKDYRLNISREQQILIEKKRNENQSIEEINAYSFDLVDEYKKYILSLSVNSDINELRHWLDSVNRYVFTEALRELEE